MGYEEEADKQVFGDEPLGNNSSSESELQIQFKSRDFASEDKHKKLDFEDQNPTIDDDQESDVQIQLAELRNGTADGKVDKVNDQDDGLVV